MTKFHQNFLSLLTVRIWRVPAHCDFLRTRGSHFWFKKELIVQNEWLREVQFPHFFIQKLSMKTHEWLRGINWGAIFWIWD
jgi:hypothetical protein